MSKPMKVEVDRALFIQMKTELRLARNVIEVARKFQQPFTVSSCVCDLCELNKTIKEFDECVG